MMAGFGVFPRSGHAFSPVEVGQALAAFVERDEDGAPVPGVLGEPVGVVVPSSWNLTVMPFAEVCKVGTGIGISGLAVSENVAIAPATGIPAGQARIDTVYWDRAAAALGVAAGVPDASPEPPAKSAERAALLDLRVQAGDSALVQARVTTAKWFDMARLAVGERLFFRVSARSVVPGGATGVPLVFPPGMFAGPPIVQVTMSPGARDCTAYVDSVTKDGCTIQLGSMSVVTRTIGAVVTVEAG